jgi:hypothetical protein
MTSKTCSEIQYKLSNAYDNVKHENNFKRFIFKTLILIINGSTFSHYATLVTMHFIIVLFILIQIEIVSSIKNRIYCNLFTFYFNLILIVFTNFFSLIVNSLQPLTFYFISTIVMSKIAKK